MAAPRTKLFVGHLPEGCTNEELKSLFERYGTVAECDVINKYGFVHMSSPEEAEEAIKSLNNYNYRGSSLIVQRSKSKLHPEPGAPGRARGVMPMMRGRGGYGDGNSPPHRGYRNGFNRSEGPPFGGRRMRPYPSPHDRRSMPHSRDDYPYRSSRGMSREPYARPSAPPRDMYKRRATASTNYYRSSRRSLPVQKSRVNRGSSICSSDDRSCSSPEIIYEKINLRSHRECFPMDGSRACVSRSSSCSSNDRSISSEPSSIRRKKFRSQREHSPMDRSRAGGRRSSSCSYDDRASSSEPPKKFRNHRERSPIDRSRAHESRSSTCSSDDHSSSSEPSATRKKKFKSFRERSPMNRSRAGERRSSSCSSNDRASSSESSSTRKENVRSHRQHSPMDRSFIATSKIFPERSARAREKERRSSICSSDDRSSLSPEPEYTGKKSPQVIGIDRRSSPPRKIRRSPSPGPSRKRESYPDQVPNYHDFMMAASRMVPPRSARACEKVCCISLCTSDDRSSSSPCKSQ